MRLLLVTLCALSACQSNNFLSGLEGPSTFSISVADAPASLQAGSVTNLRVVVTRVRGKTEPIGAIRFLLGAPPVGMSVSGDVAGSANDGILTLITTAETPAGMHTITLIGDADAGRTAAASFTLQIAGAAENESFSLAVAPSGLQVTRGEQGSATVTVTRSSGFVGDIELSAMNPPSGVGVSISPSTVSGSSATITLSVESSAPLGLHALLVRGEHGGDAATAALDLDVVAPMIVVTPPSVSASASTVSASPGSAPADDATTVTVTVTLRDTSNALVSGKTVALASSRGVSDTIAPASTSTNASGVAMFTVRSGVVGSATLTATDTSDNVVITQTASASFTAVTPAAPTVTSLSPATGPASGGTSTTITGTGFQPGATATVGGVACATSTYMSATSLVCVTPPKSAGAYDVSVINPDTQFGTKPSAFLYVSSAVLQFDVGATSPKPPNPDSYGSGNVDVTHTYTLKNTGTATSSAITLSLTGTNANRWGIELATGGDCVSASSTLAPAATCTVRVTFLAGSGTGGVHTATLQATAASGGTATNVMNGTAAYTWAPGDGVNFAPGSSYDTTTVPTGPCPSKNATSVYKYADAPGGVQFMFFHSGSADGGCSGNYNYVHPYANAMRQCNVASPTYGSVYGSGSYATCYPTNLGTNTVWRGLNNTTVDSCDPFAYIVRWYYCN